MLRERSANSWRRRGACHARLFAFFRCVSVRAPPLVAPAVDAPFPCGSASERAIDLRDKLSQLQLTPMRASWRWSY